MARFSVERNMVSNQGQQLSVASNDQMINGQLNFPATFDKFTIGLDRDGVLNELGGVIDTPDKYIPIANAARAVAIMRSLGHKICVLHDQPLISQRKITIQQVETLNQVMLNTFGAAGCTSIDGIYYNTSNKKEDEYAKPKTGLIKHAEGTLPGINFKGGVYVGDSIEDLVMADRAGATPILVLTGNGQKTLEKLDSLIYKMLKPKVKVFDNLMAYAMSLASPTVS